MYRVAAADASGNVLLWRTPAPAAAGVPPPCAPVLTPWGRPGRHETEAVRLHSPVEDAGGDPTAYCEALGLHILSRRKIVHGEVLFVKRNDEYLVVKHQSAGACVVSEAATPGPAVCEMRALIALNRLMASHRVAPVFCELWAKSPSTHAVMRAYVTDLADWVRGDGRDPARVCRAKPAYLAPADPCESWVHTRCAGNSLARSTFTSDVRLFNDTLRCSMVQVFLGLAQAQRHCLFTHNDLHCGNVMFEHCNAGVSRLFVTGCGSFLLPRRSARVRVIDFQHACFMDGRARVAGVKDDVHNAFSLTYDVWRVCSNLLWDVLRPYYDVVDEDLLALLWRGAHDEPGALPPRMEAEVHWKPYLLDGPTPADMLSDAAFDRFRCAPTACADEVYFENAPSADVQAAYIRTVVFHHRGPLPVPRDVAYGTLGRPPRRVNEAARSRLAVFARNYEGTVLGRAVMYHKHSPNARARYLFMELCMLQTLLDHMWGPACVAEVARRADDDAETCALADGIGVVLHSDLAYIARPPAMADYNVLVKAAANTPCVLEVLAAPPGGSGLSAAEEEHLLDVRLDGDLERWRGVFVRAVS
jgi:hypothetical protein